MSAPKPIWDRIVTRREREFGIFVRSRNKRVARAYDKITIDDVMAFLARADVARRVTGRTERPDVPQEIKDYLTKQGVTLPER
jgi:hypothetical protein